MNDLEAPLVPSAAAPLASGLDASSNQATDDGTTTLNDDVLDQIRFLLIDAGVTSQTLGLPAESSTNRAKRRAIRRVSFGSSDRTTLGQWAKHRRASLDNREAEYPIAEDLYNMVFISKNWSLPFFYAVFNVCIKFALYGIVIFWIFRPGGFLQTKKALGEKPTIILVTQLLLIPVSIGITEELTITMDIMSKMGWKKLDNHPHATKLKFGVVNMFRALDGLAWHFVITSLMLNARDVLKMFLNFAALQFLQCIDNSAFDMAQGGYLSLSIEAVALEVSKATLPSVKGTWRAYAGSMFLTAVFLLTFVYWAVLTS